MKRVNPCYITVIRPRSVLAIMNVCSVEEDDGACDCPRAAEGDEATNQEEFDFVEQPSEDFFCPVTFELLLSPHQITCCGHHLSEKAVNRLQREGKPCPMCKEPTLATMPDKFFKRKASAVLIRCPYKESECEWVGEVGGANKHIDACPKRPWECQHCDFVSTFDVGIQHVELCTKYPIPCPNKCEIGTIPRCDVEKHRTECPLEPVACELANVGCSVKVARRDLKQHMEENQQQHLLSATLLNLKLTRETIMEKDRILALKDQELAEKEHQLAEKDRQITSQLAEKDRQIADKDNQLAEKDCQIADKDRQIADKNNLLAEKDRRVADKDQQLAEKDKVIADKMLEAIMLLQQGVVEFTGHIHGFTHHRFTLERFSECQKGVGCGDWLSEPFYSQPGNHKLILNVETKQHSDYLIARLKKDDKLAETKIFILGLQLSNQHNKHNHYFRMFEASLLAANTYTRPCEYIQFKELYKRDKTVRYLKDDCLRLVLWIKTKN